MRRVILPILAAMLAIAAQGFVQAHAQDAPRARAVFAETRAEWGTIIQGDKTSHRFVVRNDGGAELEIRKLEPSCHCTAALVTSDRIAPGASGEIEVRFDSTGRMGFQVAIVTVYTNDPSLNPDGSGTLRLELSGEVTTIFQAIPGTVYLAVVARGAGAVEDFTLQLREAYRGTEWNVLRIDTPRFVEVEQRKDGGVVRMKVRLQPGAPMGDFRSDMVIHTDHPKQPRVTVPVIAEVVGRIAVFPQEILMRRVEKNQPAMPSITLLFRPEANVPKGEIIDILDMRTSSGNFRVRKTYMDEGRKVELELQLLPGARPGAVADTLVLSLNDADQAEVRIPILCEIIGQVKTVPSAVWAGTVGNKEGTALGAVEVLGPVGKYEVAETSPGLGAAIEKRPDGSLKLSVTVSGPLPAGPLAGQVVLRGDVPGEERIVIPVRGVIEEAK